MQDFENSNNADYYSLDLVETDVKGTLYQKGPAPNYDLLKDANGNYIPTNPEVYMVPDEGLILSSGSPQHLNTNDKDDLYQSALEIIKTEGKASTSFLQRKLQIGYNRAARIIDMMEDEGIVSKANHVGKRDVL